MRPFLLIFDFCFSSLTEFPQSIITRNIKGTVKDNETGRYAGRSDDSVAVKIGKKYNTLIIPNISYKIEF